MGKIKKRTILSILITVVIVILTAKFWLISDPARHIDVKVLVIILVLTYLSAYKLTDYIADFKTVQNKSRIDIIFLTIFFVFLFIPMSHINKEEISVQENRTLAKWHSLINENNEINFNFGKEFNEWYNDRFNSRSLMINLNDFLKLKLCYKYCTLGDIHYNKKSHWAIHNTWTMFDYISEREIESMKSNVKKLDEFCKKNNIKYYILVVPSSAQIYPNEYRPFITKEYESALRVKNKINGYLNKEVIIYPLDELKQAAKYNYVFTKSDPHYSEYGAFETFKVLMDRIKKDFKNLKIPSETDYVITDRDVIRTDWGGAYWLGYYYYSLKLKHLFDKYPTYINNNEDKLKVVNKDEELLYEDTYFPYGNDLNAYIIGTSFAENFNLFAKYSFRNNYKRSSNRGSGKLEIKRWEDDIINKKTDVLILVFQDNAISKIITQFYDFGEKQ